MSPLPDARTFDPGERALVDEAYRFRLAAPDARWLLLDRSDAQAVVPGASAAALLPGAQVFVQVLVERTDDDVSLESVAELHATALKLKPAGRILERTQHQGRDALKLGGVRGGDREIEVRSLVLRHQQHLYELRVSAPRGEATGAAIDSLFDVAVRHFSLLSGVVRPPPPLVAAQPDARGPAWRVRGGVFESSGSALRVAPPPGWRLVLGSELQELTPDADIGLQRSDPPLFLTVVAERVGESELEVVRRKIGSQVRLVADGERHTLRWHGRPLELAQIEADGFPENVAVLFATRFQRGRYYQMVLGRNTRDGMQHVQAALDALSLLEPADEQALARDLSAGPDPEATLAGEHALWGGRFRDLDRGITWVKPDAEWTAEIGSAAAQTEGAILRFEHARLGLFGYLLPFDDPAGDARMLLRAALNGFVSEGRAQQIPIHTLALDADSSAACETDATVDGTPFRFAMAGAVTGKRGAVLVVGGLPGNMRSADAQVKAALGGLGIAREPLPKHSVTDGAFTSWRYGFKLALPGGPTWSGPRELQRGSLDFVGWAAPEQTIAIVAVAGSGMASRTADLLRVGLRQLLRGRADVTPAMSPQTVAGRPGQRMSLEFEGSRVDVFVTTRGDQLYLLMVEQKGADRSAERADAAAAGFELLE